MKVRQVLRQLSVAIGLVAFQVAMAAYADEATPPLTEEAIVHAIASDLAYNAPHLTIELDEAKPIPAIDSLVHAGVLRILGTTAAGPNHCAGMKILLLTDQGQKIAQERGWSVAGGELNIPTGRLVYVPRSYTIVQSGRTTDVTYAWRYEGNDNLSYLLRLGPPTSWPKSMYPTCFDAAGNPTSRTVERKIVVTPDGFGSWSNLEQAIYPVDGCGNTR